MGMNQGTFRVAADKLDLMVDEGSYLFYGLESLLKCSEYSPILANIRTKQGGKAMLDKDTFKTLVRDMLSGKVTAPTVQEVKR